MVEGRFERDTVGATSSVVDWASREAAIQSKPEMKVAERGDLAGGKTSDAVTESGLKRVFAPGTEITNKSIETAGLASNPEQLNLERNLLYRDANPKAFFITPGLNDKIDKLTGTTGDGSDPANKASNIELTGAALENSKVLFNHEAVAKIGRWRDNNPDKLVDDGFPPRMSAEDVAKETSPTRIQDALNDLFASKGQPMNSPVNIAKYGRLKAYQPDANFKESSAFASDEDKTYKQLLVDKRKALSESTAK